MELHTLDSDPRVHDATGGGDPPAFWWSPAIERLQREGRLAEALALAWSRMEAVQDERPLPYGWAWGVAVLARRMRWYDLEVEVIERVLAIAADGGTSAQPWEARLAEAKPLAAQILQP